MTDNYEFVPAFNESKVEFELAGTKQCEDFKKYKELLKDEIISAKVELFINKT